MAKGDTLTLLALAGVGIATGGLALPALAPALAGAGAATAAAGTAAAATTSAFSISGALMGAGAFLSAGTSYLQGQAAATANKAMQAGAVLDLAGEQTQFALEEEDRQRKLQSMLSTQTAIFGASGITSEGVGDVIARSTVGSINRETDLKTTLSNINQNQLRNQASSYGDAASAARTQGVLKAGSSLLNFAGQSFNNTRTS